MKQGMLTGAHSVIYSTNPEADRAFFRDVLALPNVDVGHGWLVFGLPPSEVAVHPAEKNNVHELYLMCDDIDATLAQLAQKGVEMRAIQERPWGRVTQIPLPSGEELGLYEPRHPTAIALHR